MGVYRVSRRFTVESGHMLSRHPEACRFPHGHTRHIEIVVVGDSLDENGMLVDFKALKLALKEFLDRFDHSMAINTDDPLFPVLAKMYAPEAIVPFEGAEPTTEAIAKLIFDYADRVLADGFESGSYRIPAGRVRLERVRVGETPSTWAEYSA